MNENKSTNFDQNFAVEIEKGLTASPKNLNSKYFYDDAGDRIFQQIMEMPEYYLTRSETEVLQKHVETIASHFKGDDKFDLIELGAGDGSKTKILIEKLLADKADFDYAPIDISQNILDVLKENLQEEFPKLSIIPKQGTYFEVLEDLDKFKNRKKVILFLGSNIGNLEMDNALEFLKNIRKNMSGSDLLFMGFDLKKHPDKIEQAYNDPAGITKRFNMNILKRINRELNGDFNINQFMHKPTYNPETGRMDSFLVSCKKQEVYLEKLDKSFFFEAWESIHTEISQKYTDALIKDLSKEAGLQIVQDFHDNSRFYKNLIFKVKD